MVWCVSSQVQCSCFFFTFTMFTIHICHPFMIYDIIGVCNKHSPHWSVKNFIQSNNPFHISTHLNIIFSPSFLPMHPLRGVWVFRWTFSSSPPPSPSHPSSSHLQLFVSVRYRKCYGGAFGSLAVYAILFNIP